MTDADLRNLVERRREELGIDTGLFGINLNRFKNYGKLAEGESLLGQITKVNEELHELMDAILYGTQEEIEQESFDVLQASINLLRVAKPTKKGLMKRETKKEQYLKEGKYPRKR